MVLPPLVAGVHTAPQRGGSRSVLWYLPHLIYLLTRIRFRRCPGETRSGWCWRTDSLIVRDGVRSLLLSAGDLEVVGVADAERLLRRVAEGKPIKAIAVTVDRAERAVHVAGAMHARQAELNARWEASGLPAFRLGIGDSTGDVAAALLGSDERLECSVVGDGVNLAQRLQEWAEGGQTVLSDPAYALLANPPDCERLEPALVKGRQTPVSGHRFGVAA